MSLHWFELLFGAIVGILILGLVVFAGYEIYSYITRVREGTIYDKEFIAAHTETGVRPMTIGKTTTMIPYTTHHPDRWYIDIENSSSGKRKTYRYEVSEQEFDLLEMGEFWYEGKPVDRTLPLEEPES
jgi:hypothetical protein